MATAHPALTDERTGLPNRLQFETVFRFLFAGADRGVPLTLLMVEVTAQDDAIVREAARRLASTSRSADLMAHLGDGRFATLLLGCNLQGGRLAADRIAGILGRAIGDGFAVGLAPWDEDMKEPTQLMEAAARATAKARAAGGGSEIGLE